MHGCTCMWVCMVGAGRPERSRQIQRFAALPPPPFLRAPSNSSESAALHRHGLLSPRPRQRAWPLSRPRNVARGEEQEEAGGAHPPCVLGELCGGGSRNRGGGERPQRALCWELRREEEGGRRKQRMARRGTKQLASPGLALPCSCSWTTGQG